MNGKKNYVDLEIKLRIVEELKAGQKSIDLAKEFGVNINTVWGYAHKLKIHSAFKNNGRPKNTTTDSFANKKSKTKKKVFKFIIFYFKNINYIYIVVSIAKSKIQR
jgi:hypothetical protein